MTNPTKARTLAALFRKHGMAQTAAALMKAADKMEEVK